jgi:uncharacterized protein (TIGR02246 family)
MSDALERVLDHLAIRELTARYNRAFDDVDSEAWADTFTPDGVMEYGGGAPISGRDALVEMSRKTGYGFVHITTDPIIEIDGDRATQSCTLIVASRSEARDQVAIGMTGRYEDELVRTQDGWRFKRRTATLDIDLGS